MVGLLRALERYDTTLEVPLWGYATRWVRQAMQQLIFELTRPMVLSDRTLRHLAQLKRAHGEYPREHGHEPAGGQLASDTGLSARYGLDGQEESLRDIGERIGLSGERVRQIENRALGNLRAATSRGPSAGES